MKERRHVEGWKERELTERIGEKLRLKSNEKRQVMKLQEEEEERGKSLGYSLQRPYMD
ncbi:hypothetical protein Hanom_Chr09g00829771 [Helianthus anomalus]